mgnify:CR=1 FL=1
MTLPSNDAYLKIGQTISDILPETWQSIRLTASIPDEGVMSLDGLYIDTIGDEHKIVIPDSVLREFFQIYNLMSKSLKGKWKKMVYTLRADGQLDVSFDY